MHTSDNPIITCSFDFIFFLRGWGWGHISSYLDPVSSGYRSSVPRGSDKKGGTVLEMVAEAPWSKYAQHTGVGSGMWQWNLKKKLAEASETPAPAMYSHDNIIFFFNSSPKFWGFYVWKKWEKHWITVKALKSVITVYGVTTCSITNSSSHIHGGLIENLHAASQSWHSSSEIIILILLGPWKHYSIDFSSIARVKRRSDLSWFGTWKGTRGDMPSRDFLHGSFVCTMMFMEDGSIAYEKMMVFSSLNSDEMNEQKD